MLHAHPRPSGEEGPRARGPGARVGGPQCRLHHRAPRTVVTASADSTPHSPRLARTTARGGENRRQWSETACRRARLGRAAGSLLAVEVVHLLLLAEDPAPPARGGAHGRGQLAGGGILAHVHP